MIEQFEEAWRAGSPPQVEEVLAAVETADRLSLLLELVQIDLERRLAAGEQVRAESYFSRFPELADNYGVAIELIAAEFSHRRKAEPCLAAAEFIQRFPTFSGQLEARLSVLGSDATTLARPNPGRDRAAHSVSDSAATSTRPASDTWRPQLATGAMDRPSLPRLFGDYELLEEIARGGMGVVYKARQLGLNRLVALKMILAGELAGEEAVRRFRGEAEAAAQLRHPGIVAVYEVGEHEGQHFFSMEYVAGKSLSILAREKPYSAEAAARLTQAVAEAIHFAHEHRVLHRDLKPANVLIDVDGRPRVTDFGLAKRMDVHVAGLTQTHDVMGTPSYMPPEQAAGRIRELGPRSDVYSLGAIFYELLAGRPPFRAETPLETLREVLERDPVSPRLLNPKTPRDAETICLTCLDKDPARRYSSAQDLADELGRFLRHEPIVARPLGPASRAVRWCRRKPLAATAAALAALVLALLAIGGPIWAVRESGLKQAAYNKEQEAIRAKRETSQAEVTAQQEKATAIRERNEARRQAQITEVRRLASESRAARGRLPAQSLLLAIEAVERSPRGEGSVLAAAETELRECLATTGGLPVPGGNSVAISPRGRWLATAARDGLVRLCDLHAADPTAVAHTLRGPGAGTTHLAFAPDDRWLATRGESGNAHIWNLTKADPSADPLVFKGFKEGVGLLAASDDGKWLVTTSGESGRVWDLTSADPTANWRTLSEHEGAATCLAISPGGPWLATGEFFNVVRIWDLTSTDLDFKPRELAAQNGMTTCLAFSAGGRWLAAGCVDGKVLLTDLAASDPAAASHTLAGHEGPVSGVAFSSDGKWLATGSADKTARLWDLEAQNASAPARVLRGHEEKIECLAIAPDGRWLATGSADRTVRIWDLAVPAVPASIARGPQGSLDLPALNLLGAPGGQNSARANELVLRGHEAPVKQLAFSPDAHWLVTGSADDSSRLWDLTAEGTSPRVLRGHERGLAFAAFADEGRRLFTGGLDNTFRLWDVAGSGARTLRVHDGSITCAATSADGRWLAAGTERSVVWLWDLASPMGGETPRMFTGHEGVVRSAVFLTNEPTLITGSQDNTIRLWDLSTPSPATTSRVLQGHTGGVMSLAVNSDGRSLASASSDGTVRLWNLAAPDPQASGRLLPGLEGAVYNLALSENGRRLATVNSEHSVLLWDLAETHQTEPRSLRGHQQPVTRLAFSRDGTRLATGGMDGVARVWDLSTDDPEPHAKVLRGHEGPISSLALTPDGDRLVTGGADKTIRLWSLEAADSQTSATVLRGHEGPITSLDVTSDGSQLVSASQDGTARLWDLRLYRLVALGRAIAGRSLSSEEQAQHRLRKTASQGDVVELGQLPRIGPGDVLAGWPTSAGFHEHQAETSQAAQASFAALFHADRLIEIEPALSRHRAFRSRLLLDKERWREAAADLEIVATAGQDDPSLLHALALAHLAAGQHDKYALACASLHDRASGPPWLFSLLDATRLSPRHGIEPARLVSAAEEFARLENNVGQRLLGAALYRRGEYDKVLPCYQTAARFSPHMGWDHFFLAMTYHRLGKAGEARAALETGKQWIEHNAPFVARSWQVRLGMNLLRQEATDLLDKPDAKK